jgi:hypothetical protein
MYPSDWFDGPWAKQQPPADCVRDCSSQGRVDETVDYWAKKLNLTAPPWLLRRYLKGFGAWEPDELCNHDQNLRRLLWIWCCDIKEAAAGGGEPCPMYLGV